MILHRGHAAAKGAMNCRHRVLQGIPGTSHIHSNTPYTAASELSRRYIGSRRAS